MWDDAPIPRAARRTREYLAFEIRVESGAATRGQRLPGAPARCGLGDESSRPCGRTTAARVSADRPPGPETTTDHCVIQRRRNRASAALAPAALAAKPQHRQKPGTSRGSDRSEEHTS